MSTISNLDPSFLRFSPQRSVALPVRLVGIYPALLPRLHLCLLCLLCLHIIVLVICSSGFQLSGHIRFQSTHTHTLDISTSAPDMRPAQLLALVAALPSTLAAYKGFNYGSAGNNQASFEGQFNSAKALGFNSARLYTMIQDGTTNTPIEAIPAAISSGTSLLLGLWASAGDAQFANEIAALNAAISQYGSAFADLVAGISVGSEDIYRVTPIGISNNAGAGAGPDVIVGYIDQVRSAVAGSGLASKPIGHVDTYNVWTNSSQNALIGACDFLGMDAYPYYETTKQNSIENANATFWDDYDQTAGVSQGKPVWIAETGWPVSGPTSGLAVASVQNAQTYYDGVGCTAFGDGINTWWYILQDTGASPSFGVVGAGSPPPTTPLYSLTC
jgi:glucan endo-1,3-beta-D-glucosidase